MTTKKIIIITILLITFSIVVVYNTEDKKQNNVILNYTEKVSGLYTYEFDKNNKLIRKLNAESYITYNAIKSLIIEPYVQVYNNKPYNISANFAKYIDKETIKFIGDVKIDYAAGNTHKLNTNSLITNTSTDYIYSNDKVKYFANENIIESNGIRFFNNTEIVELTGETTIITTNKQTLKSKNVSIKKYSNSLDYIFSESKSDFINKNSTATSSKGFHILKNNIKLVGDVVIKRQGAKITTTELNIKNNIYTAKNSSKYVDKNMTIISNTFVYNDLKEIINLSGNIKGTYE